MIGKWFKNQETIGKWPKIRKILNTTGKNDLKGKILRKWYKIRKIQSVNSLKSEENREENGLKSGKYNSEIA